MKKVYFFLILFFSFGFLSSCSKKVEHIFTDKYNESTFYCKDKNSLLSLLREKEIIDDSFDWETEILDNSLLYLINSGTFPDYEKILSLIEIDRAYSSIYNQFSFCIIETIDENNIKFKYKDGFYVALDLNNHKIIYLSYIEFNKNKEISPVHLLVTESFYRAFNQDIPSVVADDIKRAVYINTSKSWEFDN